MNPADSAAHGARTRAPAAVAETVSVPFIEVIAGTANHASAPLFATFTSPPVVVKASNDTFAIASLLVIVTAPPTLVRRDALNWVMYDPDAVPVIFNSPPIVWSELKL